MTVIMEAIYSLVLSVLALMTYSESFLLSNNDEYQVWLTTGDKSRTLSRQSPCPVTSQHHGYSVWVDRNKRRQTIYGFGAALTNSAAWAIYHSPIRSQIIQDLFGSGIDHLGVSYLRLPMGCSDLQAVDAYTYDDVPYDYNLDHFSIDKDRQFVIPVLKEALSVNPSLKILATPWSAPAWMKTSNSLNGGDFKTDTRIYHTYAMYFVKFIEAYRAEGIHIESLTVQNEPLLSAHDYPTMKMSADQQKVFIRDHLGPLFRQRNINTKILIFDHNWSDAWYPEQIISDGNAKQYISGVAWHGYGGRHDAPGTFHNQHPDVDMYFTEISGGDWDPHFDSTLTFDMRNILIGQTRNWATTVMFWSIALDQNHGPKAHGIGGCNNCRGVITVPTNSHHYEKNAEYYTLGHMSRFVKPGAVRLESNYISWDELRTVAFVNPDGTTVIVVHNPSSSQSASFSLDIDAKHYQYNNLPPNSVVTFVK